MNKSGIRIDNPEQLTQHLELFFFQIVQLNLKQISRDYTLTLGFRKPMELQEEKVNFRVPKKILVNPTRQMFKKIGSGNSISRNLKLVLNRFKY